MLQTQTKIAVADNSGAKLVYCIQVLGSTRKRYAFIGDIIRVSVRSVISGRSKIKKGDMCKAVVVRTTCPLVRKDGGTIRFDKNAVVLLDNDYKLIGTRVFGPVTRELRQNKQFAKIVSLAPEVI